MTMPADIERIAAGPVASVLDLAAWLANVASGKWSWVRNRPCKYVTLYIDTRSGAYRIEDRDGNAIDFETLMRGHPHLTKEKSNGH